MAHVWVYLVATAASNSAIMILENNTAGVYTQIQYIIVTAKETDQLPM